VGLVRSQRSRRPRARGAALRRLHRDRSGREQRVHLTLVCRRHELPGQGQHPRPQAYLRGIAARAAQEARPEGKRCSSNTSRSSPRSTRPISPTGAWRSSSRKKPGRARRCSSTPATTTPRRTSSRSSRGSSMKTCSAASTQRPPLCRRRSHARLDRSVSGLSHLPRNPFLRRRPWPRPEDRLHDRSIAQREAQDRGDDPNRGDGAGAFREGRHRRSRCAPPCRRRRTTSSMPSSS